MNNKSSGSASHTVKARRRIKWAYRDSGDCTARKTLKALCTLAYRADARLRTKSGFHPVLYRKPGYAAELALVIGHQHGLDVAGVRGDKQIVRADRFAA